MYQTLVLACNRPASRRVRRRWAELRASGWEAEPRHSRPPPRPALVVAAVTRVWRTRSHRATRRPWSIWRVRSVRAATRATSSEAVKTAIRSELAPTSTLIRCRRRVRAASLWRATELSTASASVPTRKSRPTGRRRTVAGRRPARPPAPVASRRSRRPIWRRWAPAITASSTRRHPYRHCHKEK